MKIKFTKDAIYETKGRGQGQHFKAGEVHDLRDDLAQRWISRDMAEAVDKPPSTLKEAAPKERPKAPERKRAANAANVTIASTWKTALTPKETEALANSLVDKPVASHAEALDVIESELAERAKK